MAGTTVADDGQVPAAFAAAMAAAGVPVSPGQIGRVRGTSKRHAIRQLLPPHQEARADAIYADFANRLKVGFAETVRQMPGAAAVMADLRSRGIKVALNTGFDREITAMLIDALGWATVADTAICSDDVANGRPAPDMILLAMARTGVTSPNAVANVGDTRLDLEAGHRAGVAWNIGVLSGAHSRQELQRAPHTHIVPSLAELPF